MSRKRPADCCDESEAVTGFLTTIEAHLELPLTTVVLGANVKVTGLDLTEREEVAAVCALGKRQPRIPVCERPLPSPLPPGAEARPIVIGPPTIEEDES